MHPASVGFQCPKCVAGDRVRQPRTAFGVTLKPTGGSMTKILMVVLAVVYVLDLVTRGLLSNWLVMANELIYFGQYWRLLTGALISGSLIGLLMNLLVLWIAGRAIEAELGGWRFVALYLAAGHGGATIVFLLAPSAGVVVTSGAAVIGLIAANAVGKLKTHEDIRADIGLLILLVLYSVLINFSGLGWLGLIGGIAVGALVGYLLAYAPRRNRNVLQIVGLVGIMLVCLLAVVAKIAIF